MINLLGQGLSSLMGLNSATLDESTATTSTAAVAKKVDSGQLSHTIAGDAVWLSAAARQAGDSGLTLDNVSRIARNRSVYGQVDGGIGLARQVADLMVEARKELPSDAPEIAELQEKLDALTPALNSGLKLLNYKVPPEVSLTVDDNGKLRVQPDEDGTTHPEAAGIENLLNNAQYGGALVADAMQSWSPLQALNAASGKSSSSGSSSGLLGAMRSIDIGA
jgi:hypothetical protein